MSQPENMPENSAVPEAARDVPKSQLVIVGSGGEYRGVYKPPEAPKPSEDPLLPRRVEEAITERGASEFDRARLLYDHYKRLPVPVDQRLRDERQRRIDQNRVELERLEQQAENHPAKPVKLITGEMLEAYKRIRETRIRELQGGGRRDAIERERSRGGLQDRIFEDYDELAPESGILAGIGHYLWDGFVSAVADHEKGITDLTIKNPFAKKYFERVERMRQRERMSTKEGSRYFQTESWYGGTIVIFSWPESARDMIITTMSWIKDRIADIGQRDPGTASGEFEEMRKQGPMLVRNSRLRINDEPVLVAEHGKILEKNPEYLRSRALSEGLPDVFATEIITKKGNTEFGPQAKERFAARFIDNFNAMFLENPHAAYLMHRLRTYKDGTFYTGHDWHTDKAEEGDIKEYRAKIQEELIGESATLDFFPETVFVNNQDLFQDVIEGKDVWATANNREDVRLAYKGFFELREKKGLQYRTNDPLERLLLDPGNVIRQRIAGTGDAEALKRHDVRVAVFRRTKELLDRREGFDFISLTEIYKLEKRLRRPLSDKELADLAEVHKDIRREELQQHLIAHGLNPGDFVDAIEIQLQREKEERRQESIRNRIRARVEELSRGKSYFAESCAETLAQLDAAKQGGDLAKCDQIAWEWVKGYNSRLIQFHLPKWYPTGWDRVRIKIDRAAKVIDRSLTEEERVAMYETAYLPVGNDEESAEKRLDLIKAREEEARFGFEMARVFSPFLMESSLLGGMRIRMVMKKGPHAGEYIGRLDDDETSVLCGLIKGRVNPQTREIEVERDANGEAIIIDPERKSIRISDIVEARQAKAIADEEHEIEPLRLAKRKALVAMYKAERSGNQAEMTVAHQALDKAAKDLREKLRDCQFVVTHAYKAKGLVNGRWPTWPQASALDNSGIKLFGEILAEYGVEVAPGMPFADYKKEIYEYLERERRGQLAEMDRATQEFMEGKYPFYERDEWSGEIIMEPVLDEAGHPKLDAQNNPMMVPKPAISIFTMSNDWGEPGELYDRMRVVNKGDWWENLMVTEAEYNLSTSGGVKFTEYIPFARLNFFPLGIWGLGSPGIWDLNNFIKRRNEVEAHKQKMLDPTDMPKNAKAQATAYLARKALTGGSLGEGKSTPGFLMEPIHGAWQVADALRNFLAEDVRNSWGLGYTRQYVDLMNKMRAGETSPQDPELEKARQFTYVDYYILAAKGKTKSNELYITIGKVFDYFTIWLQAEKEVEQNRIGNSPRNWPYDNTKRWYAFRREIRKSLAKKGKGIIDRLGYSGEVTSEMSLSMAETMLMDGDYLILRDYERARLAQEGALILSKVLNETEKGKGRALLYEVNWQFADSENQREALKAAWEAERPEVKKALENVRRRGLLEFMIEEGFSWYTMDRATGKYGKEKINNLGEKIPPLIRQEMASGKMPYRKSHDNRD